MLNILFITSVSHKKEYRNLNSFQRVYFLSRSSNFTILGCKGADFNLSAQKGTRIINSPIPGKLGLIIYGIFWMFLYIKDSNNLIVITEPSIIGILGFLCKVINNKIKWVVDVWDIPFRCHSSSSRLTHLRIAITRAVFKILYKYADLFIVSILPDFELKYFNTPESKMLLLNNAIWFDNLSFKVHEKRNNNEFNMLCTRSIYTEDMGLDTLTEAFIQLKSKIPGIALTVLGKIPEEVEPQVQMLKNHSEAKFTEFIDYDKLKKIIGSADVCVVPFKSVPDLAQTYPVKVLEYLAMGKPVVASRIAGIKTMVQDGHNGILFNPGDVDDLVKKIEFLYRNKSLCEKISKNARNLDSKYDCRVKNKIIFKRIRAWLNRPLVKACETHESNVVLH